MLKTIAKFSYRHRRLVLIGWISALLITGGLAQKFGSAFSTDFKLPNSDSEQAYEIMAAKFPSQSGGTGDLIYKSELGVNDPSVRQTSERLFKELATVPHVSEVLSPYRDKSFGQISPNGKIARATIQFDQKITDISVATTEKIKQIVGKYAGQNSQYELGGDIFLSAQKGSTSEGIGLLAAVVILLVAFGSVLAMGLPIITALFGIGIGVSVVSLLSHVISLPDFATQLASMIGIGVGIDYALFIVTRYRQGLNQKMTPENAVITAINTAGRSVLFAGLTVVISLLGMVLMKINFIQGLGISSAFTVSVTMLASITLLPAILGFVGKNIDKLRIPGVKKQTDQASGFWYAWSNFINRHAWPVLIAGLAIIITLAIPVLSIRLGSSDASSRKTTDTTRRAYDLAAEGFGVGSNGQLVLVAELSDATSFERLRLLRSAITADKNIAFASPLIPNSDFSAAIMQVTPKTSPQDPATVDLIHRLREKVLPQVEASTGLKVHVGGITATFDDIAELLSSRLPLFIGTVLTLSFLLLMVVFRSILIPVKAVVLNMLSISAAYGVIVAVFQWGWLKSWFGVSTTGPVESFLPMMLFAILFGLSMDYEVFLLSRIKEEYDQLKDNKQAVAHGLNHTARVISAAAAIMITVFGSFIFGDERIIKEFGLGLAAAVLIDASIARLLLVPASMELFGKANWWLPKWLHWLPKIHIDGNEK